MNSLPDPPRRLRFGAFELDTVGRLLRRNGAPVPLAGKPMELLLVLVAERERVVAREELLDRLWPDVVVEDANLTQHVSVLRRALGEAAGENAFVVTVPGRGYRFVAPVRAVAELAGRAQGLLSPPQPARRVAFRWLFGPAAMAACLAGGLVLRSALPGAWSARASAPTVAVLPIQLDGLEAPADTAGIALADAVIGRLGASGVPVRATRDVLEFLDPRRDTPLEAGRQLGAGFVVAAATRELVGRSQLSAQLIRTRDGAVVATESFDLTAGALADPGPRLADALATWILESLAPAERGVAPAHAVAVATR